MICGFIPCGNIIPALNASPAGIHPPVDLQRNMGKENAMNKNYSSLIGRTAALLITVETLVFALSLV